MKDYSARPTEGVAAIPLTQGKHAIVDEVMHDLLAQWCWNFDGGYARCWNPFNRGPQIILMHRLIAGLVYEPSAVCCDHINGNTLDNRRDNLRACTNQQNQANRIKRLPTSSGYRGVSWKKEHRRWCAYIRVDGHLLHLGYHHHERDAARAYNAAALDHFGEFARLNEIAGG